MQFHELMQRLGVELNIELKPDEQGACALQLDDMTVSFYADEGHAFTAICPLGAVEPDDGDTLQEFLQANLFADGVGGSAICMDDEGGVYLSQCFDAADTAIDEFIRALERFAATAEHWRRQLATETATPDLAAVG